MWKEIKKKIVDQIREKEDEEGIFVVFLCDGCGRE
jgi:hypothetical protein